MTSNWPNRSWRWRPKRDWQLTLDDARITNPGHEPAEQIQDEQHRRSFTVEADKEMRTRRRLEQDPAVDEKQRANWARSTPRQPAHGSEAWAAKLKIVERHLGVIQEEQWAQQRENRAGARKISKPSTRAAWRPTKTKPGNEENRNLGLWPTRVRNIQTEPNKEERPAAAATNTQILVREERLSRRLDLTRGPKEKSPWVRKSKVQLTNTSQGNLVSINEVQTEHKKITKGKQEPKCKVTKNSRLSQI
jgi:hypothetical protein